MLNGAVAAAGQNHGVQTPVNAVYSRVLEDIAHMPQLWAKYRERPEALEAEVEAEMLRVKALTRSIGLPESCAIPTFPNRSKAGGFSTACSRSTVARWDGLPEKRRSKYAAHASDLVEHLQSGKDGDVGLAQIIGHKGDLMITHYARTFDGLAYAQTLVDKLEMREYFQPLGSYVRCWNLDCTKPPAKIHAELQ